MATSMRSLLIWFALAVPASPAAAVEIFVSVLPLAYLVEAVAGERVGVETLVGPGQSPATYEPSPRQMARLADAAVFVRAGVPYEAGWLPRIRAINPDLEIVDARAGISLLPLPADGHGGGHVHGNDPDPHVWTDPANAVTIAAGVRDALMRLDPAGEGHYRENFERLREELAALDAEIRTLLEGLSGRAFLVFHPAWAYFAEAYGLRQVAIEHSGKEPGPRALARIADLARAEELRVILVQRQFSRATADAVAAAIGARVEVVDPLERDYVSGMRQVAGVLKEAFR